MLLLISINMGNYPIKQTPNKDSAVHIILLSKLKHHNLSIHRGEEMGIARDWVCSLNPGENMILQDRS